MLSLLSALPIAWCQIYSVTTGPASQLPSGPQTSTNISHILGQRASNSLSVSNCPLNFPLKDSLVPPSSSNWHLFKTLNASDITWLGKYTQPPPLQTKISCSNPTIFLLIFYKQKPTHGNGNWAEARSCCISRSRSVIIALCLFGTYRGYDFGRVRNQIRKVSTIWRVEISKQADKSVRPRIKNTHKQMLSYSTTTITNMKHTKEKKT